MWCITHGNTNMNRFERLMEHKGHLERLALTKTGINTKTPLTPSFIAKRYIDKGIRMERNMKIKYENKVIFNRMYDIQKHTSPYSACKNIPSKCPAYELFSYHRLKKWDDINFENNKLRKRFTYAKPTYSNQKQLQEYKYTQYLENNISQNRNRINPNLDFVSFEKFENNLKKQREKSNKSNRNKNNKSFSSLNNSFEDNYKSCYSKQTEYNINKNEEWFKESRTNSSFRKPLTRPNSCKPNIAISREIANNQSEIYSKYNNTSVKTKPGSGKTRTNGSASTNVLTNP